MLVKLYRKLYTCSCVNIEACFLSLRKTNTSRKTNTCIDSSYNVNGYNAKTRIFC